MRDITGGLTVDEEWIEGDEVPDLAGTWIS
jgi:hypothetical protein